MQTREYLKIADAKAGMEVELDSDLLCHKSGKATLHANEYGALYFLCDNGKHFLSGQAQDDYYIGVYPCL